MKINLTPDQLAVLYQLISNEIDKIIRETVPEYSKTLYELEEKLSPGMYNDIKFMSKLLKKKY